MTSKDLALIARALDTYVNEYTGAAPEEEINRADDLANHHWGLAFEAERRDAEVTLKREAGWSQGVAEDREKRRK